MLRAHIAEREDAKAGGAVATETSSGSASLVDEYAEPTRRVEKLRGLEHQYKGETFQEAFVREVKEESASAIKCRPEVRIAKNLFEWGAFWGVPTPIVRVLRSGLTNVRGGITIDAIKRTFPNLEPKKTVYTQIDRAIKNERLMWEYELEYPSRWVHGAYIPTDDLDLFWKLYDLPREYETPLLKILADDLAVRDVANLLENASRVDAIATSEMKAASLRGKRKKSLATVSDGSYQKLTGIPPSVWLALVNLIGVEAFLREALDSRLRICIA